MKNDDKIVYVKGGPVQRRYTMKGKKIIKLESIGADGSVHDFDDPDWWVGDEDWRNDIIYDYKGKNICGNCGRPLKKNDKYCPYCGTKRGEGDFLPVLETGVPILYGPPMSHYFKCKKCGFKWCTPVIVGIFKDNYCPKCGTKHIVNTCNKEYDFFNMNLELDKSNFTFKDHLRFLLLKVKNIIESKFKLMKYCK